MKNIFTLKRSIKYAATGIIILSVIIVASGKETIIKNINSYDYQFDGQTFSSKLQLNKNVNKNKIVKTTTRYNDYYLYNNKTYDSHNYDQVTKDVVDNSSTTEYEAYNNPY